MLDSYFHPYSHSLIAAIAWSCVAGLAYKIFCSRRRFLYRKYAAFMVGAAVFSHWILDLIAHPRDLAIYDNTWKVGFGLWNYRDPEFALEIGLLGVGIMLYLTRNVLSAIRKGDRKSTRLNSSHRCISYAVFCLKKKRIRLHLCETE